MKKLVCEICGEDIIEDKDHQFGQPSWYAKHKGSEMVSVICAKCLKDNKDKWRNS